MVGITALKALGNGRVLIETGSKNEIESLGNKIREECEETLVLNTQKLRNPRMVMLNTPLK